ncbi:GDSL family lipase [Streptomyces oceani]|uniref:GDSL family lipase n=2 Tax=Streptomyces oceani TaxID=1075402 RepID=A0A1E7KN62_9ACTN|nr:SGNH/GDSL hydrolase family protein [Streptomyces oceani]OEV05385.1 GDSL family lipase [Streptomyces oceani]
MARRIATAAAYGGGGLGLLGGAAVGLIFTEVQIAKRRVGVSESEPPMADGLYGAAFARPGGERMPPPGPMAPGLGPVPPDSPPTRTDPSVRTGPSVRHDPAVREDPPVRQHPPVREDPTTAGAEREPGAGGRATARPLRLAMLGDSTAAGLGVHIPRQTPGGVLAPALAAVAERPVELRCVAVSGAQSDGLERQVSLLLGERDLSHAPDVCVIMIGANDVTHRMPPARSVRLLSDAVARLRTVGCEVVVGTCPDLGTIEPVSQPLRWIARRLSRQLAAAQTIAVVEEGGRTVSLGDLLGPEFAANPGELFGPDNYHPSVEGYATAAMALLPTLCASLNLWPSGDEHPDAIRREGILPVARAAAEAAAEGGTEVASVRGPWALLKLRRRRRPPTEQRQAPPADGASTATDRTAEADTSDGSDGSDGSPEGRTHDSGDPDRARSGHGH